MKKQVKKLTLNKMTISNLNPSEMSQKVGGLSGGSGCICGSGEPLRITRPMSGVCN